MADGSLNSVFSVKGKTRIEGMADQQLTPRAAVPTHYPDLSGFFI
jgi:hypothetical protein